MIKNLPYTKSKKLLNIDIKDHKNASICPECASKLRVCDGTKGKFIGCSSFPKCRLVEEFN